jgi:hypothetical protein
MHRKKLNPTVMINGFKDLEGSVPGSNLPVCQYTLQRARQFTDSISFALAVHPFVSEQLQLNAERPRGPAAASMFSVNVVDLHRRSCTAVGAGIAYLKSAQCSCPLCLKSAQS